MKKLLLATLSLTLIIAACKINKNATKEEAVPTDSIWVAPMPANDDPAKVDSIKQELNKRRKNKQ